MNYSVLIFIGTIGIFYRNTFVWLIESWMNNAYYSHGFLVPIIATYFIWRMKDDIFKIERRQSDSGLMLFVAGMILQIISTIYSIRFLSGLSLIITIFGILLYLFGWKLVDKIKFPILFLLLAIPLPFIDLVAPPVQTTSAVSSEVLANIMGIPVERDGLILETPAGSFEVALECSGLRSVLSLFTLSIIYAFILEGRPLMKLIIIISSIPLAMIGNILRITSVLIIANKYGKEVAIDYFHDLSSILVFIIVLLGLFMIGRCFGRLKFKKTF